MFLHRLIWVLVCARFANRADLVAENLALRQQLVVFRRQAKRPCPSWRAFLDNHLKNFVSIDFFTVPTVKFRVLFAFLALSHGRRRVVHFNVTEHPSAEWTGRQLIEAFLWDTTPRYLIRDRDGIHGDDFTRGAVALGIKQVLIAPRSPW
jgi:hypothetical protein